MNTARARNLPGRLSILLVALAAAFLLLGDEVGARAPVITVEHRVSHGDTLWDLASTFTGPEDDLRAGVDLIKELNGLASSELLPGQVLLLPAG
jgi:hypothetical protein